MSNAYAAPDDSVESMKAAYSAWPTGQDLHLEWEEIVPAPGKTPSQADVPGVSVGTSQWFNALRQKSLLVVFSHSRAWFQSTEVYRIETQAVDVPQQGPEELRWQVHLQDHKFFAQSATLTARTAHIQPLQMDFPIEKRDVVGLDLMHCPPAFVKGLFDWWNRQPTKQSAIHDGVMDFVTEERQFFARFDVRSKRFIEVRFKLLSGPLCVVKYVGALSSGLYPAPQPEFVVFEFLTAIDDVPKFNGAYRYTAASFIPALPSQRYSWTSIAAIGFDERSKTLYDVDGQVNEKRTAALRRLPAPEPVKFVEPPKAPGAMQTAVERPNQLMRWLGIGGITLIALAAALFLRKRISG